VVSVIIVLGLMALTGWTGWRAGHELGRLKGQGEGYAEAIGARATPRPHHVRALGSSSQARRRGDRLQ